MDSNNRNEKSKTCLYEEKDFFHTVDYKTNKIYEACVQNIVFLKEDLIVNLPEKIKNEKITASEYVNKISNTDQDNNYNFVNIYEIITVGEDDMDNIASGIKNLGLALKLKF